VERQQVAFGRVHDLVERAYAFAGKAEARSFFTRLAGCSNTSTTPGRTRRTANVSEARSMPWPRGFRSKA